MNRKRRQLVTGAIAGSAVWSSAPAQVVSPTAIVPSERIAIWPALENSASRAIFSRLTNAEPLQEKLLQRSLPPAQPDRALQAIQSPHLVVFRPAAPNGASVLIMPGGGYRWVVVDREGFEVAHRLATTGITAFVLFYRLPGDGWVSGANTALIDAQRAIRYIRHEAKSFDIDPARVAAMGFSAGGHVCADLLARSDQRLHETVDEIDSYPARPFLAAPLYPVISMEPPYAHAVSRERLLGKMPSTAKQREHSPHLHVTSAAPPTFLLHAADDPSVSVENTMMMRQALKASNVPLEMHIFESGGHGFGLSRAVGKPVAVWLDLFHVWARSHGWY